MRRIHFTEIIRRALGKFVRGEARQAVLSRQLAETLPQCGLQKCSSSEQIPALGNVDSPELSRPFEGVLEDVAVDGFQMRRVNLAGQWRFEQLGEVPMRAASLESCEFLRISETAEILEDGRAGVQIRIRTLGC
jgi:hypothetical protein